MLTIPELFAILHVQFLGKFSTHNLDQFRGINLHRVSYRDEFQDVEPSLKRFDLVYK